MNFLRNISKLMNNQFSSTLKLQSTLPLTLSQINPKPILQQQQSIPKITNFTKICQPFDKSSSLVAKWIKPYQNLSPFRIIYNYQTRTGIHSNYRFNKNNVYYYYSSSAQKVQGIKQGHDFEDALFQHLKTLTYINQKFVKYSAQTKQQFQTFQQTIQLQKLEVYQKQLRLKIIQKVLTKAILRAKKGKPTLIKTCSVFPAVDFIVITKQFILFIQAGISKNTIYKFNKAHKKFITFLQQLEKKYPDLWKQIQKLKVRFKVQSLDKNTVMQKFEIEKNLPKQKRLKSCQQLIQRIAKKTDIDDVGYCCYQAQENKQNKKLREQRQKRKEKQKNQKKNKYQNQKKNKNKRKK